MKQVVEKIRTYICKVCECCWSQTTPAEECIECGSSEVKKI